MTEKFFIYSSCKRPEAATMEFGQVFFKEYNAAPSPPGSTTETAKKAKN